MRSFSVYGAWSTPNAGEKGQMFFGCRRLACALGSHGRCQGCHVVNRRLVKSVLYALLRYSQHKAFGVVKIAASLSLRWTHSSCCAYHFMWAPRKALVLYARVCGLPQPCCYRAGNGLSAEEATCRAMLSGSHVRHCCYMSEFVTAPSLP